MPYVYAAALRSRAVWVLAGLTAAVVVLALVVVARSGHPDPTDAPSTAAMSHGTVVVNSAVIVFREGLEAILIFAAVTASFLGSNRRHRRPVVVGALVAAVATVATWFVAQAILAQFSAYADGLQAVTGLLAIGVLLLVMNWFFHKVYWTGWIGRHHRRRRELLDGGGRGLLSGQLVGFLLLGFTSVYREGFEVVLFLQNLELKAGTGTVLEGVALGLLGTAAVGVVTFALQTRLPYKRMLVVTGWLLGLVLVVMVGGTARTLQDLGWIPTTSLGVALPDWTARWLELVPTVETILAQALAAVLVVGSYYLAEHLRVRRPARRDEQPARRAEAPPAERQARGAAAAAR